MAGAKSVKVAGIGSPTEGLQDLLSKIDRQVGAKPARQVEPAAVVEVTPPPVAPPVARNARIAEDGVEERTVRVAPRVIKQAVPLPVEQEIEEDRLPKVPERLVKAVAHKFGMPSENVALYLSHRQMDYSTFKAAKAAGIRVLDGKQIDEEVERLQRSTYTVPAPEELSQMLTALEPGDLYGLSRVWGEMAQLIEYCLRAPVMAKRYERVLDVLAETLVTTGETLEGPDRAEFVQAAVDTVNEQEEELARELGMEPPKPSALSLIPLGQVGAASLAAAGAMAAGAHRPKPAQAGEQVEEAQGASGEGARDLSDVVFEPGHKSLRRLLRPGMRALLPSIQQAWDTDTSTVLPTLVHGALGLVPELVPQQIGALAAYKVGSQMMGRAALILSTDEDGNDLDEEKEVEGVGYSLEVSFNRRLDDAPDELDRTKLVVDMIVAHDPPQLQDLNLYLMEQAAPRHVKDGVYVGEELSHLFGGAELGPQDEEELSGKRRMAYFGEIVEHVICFAANPAHGLFEDEDEEDGDDTNGGDEEADDAAAASDDVE